MKRTLLLLFLAASLGAGGCAATRQSGVCGTPSADPNASGDVAALTSQGDAAWEQRSDEARLREAIGSWETVLKLAPESHDVRVKLARAHYFLADGFIRFDEEKEEEMKSHFERGTNHAELALAYQYGGYQTKWCAKQPFEEALAEVDGGAVPAMYWYATNLGKWALAEGLVTILSEKDRIKAMMDLVQKLDSAYFYTAPDRYFGAYYTKIPFPSGDLPTSATHFEASIAGSPQYLATKVLYAQMNALKAENKELFERLLKEVLAYDLSQAPEILPENTIEQRKAQDLMDEIDVYFEE